MKVDKNFYKALVKINVCLEEANKLKLKKLSSQIDKDILDYETKANEGLSELIDTLEIKKEDTQKID
jgi:hypothetical protein